MTEDIKIEISFIEMKGNGKKYKVTKKVPDLSVSVTKLYSNKVAAERQFKEWLQNL